MKVSAGTVFSFAKENPPISGCTISETVTGGDTPAVCYSLAEGTDISAEIYFYHKLLIVSAGELTVFTRRAILPRFTHWTASSRRWTFRSGRARTRPPFILKYLSGGIRI